MSQIRPYQRQDIDDNYIIQQYNLGRSVQSIANEFKCNQKTILNRLSKNNILKRQGRTKHGLRKHRLYGIWKDINKRCFNTNHKQWKDYGGRGITIYQEWYNDFQKFYNWSINNGYKNNLTIDRINNDGNYTPDNCKWSTYKEQANNTSQNHIITFNNKTQTLKQWSEELNIKYTTLHARVTRLKWSIEEAFKNE